PASSPPRRTAPTPRWSRHRPSPSTPPCLAALQTSRDAIRPVAPSSQNRLCVPARPDAAAPAATPAAPPGRSTTAAVFDVQQHRIPNWLTYPGIVLGFVLQGLLFRWEGLGIWKGLGSAGEGCLL